MKCFSLGAWLISAAWASAAEVVVRDAQQLRSAIQNAQDGMTLRIGPGEYPGGWQVSGVTNLTVEALDPEQPPVFRGGNAGWHFSRCAGLKLRHLHVVGQKVNGLNFDDGGRLDHPVEGIVIEHLQVRDIGPQGNHDAIKCSGLRRLTVRDCIIAGWGGQGIDLVGCHDSLITGCRFEGKEGFSASAGVQVKGGSSGVIVEKCHFVNAGERPLNAGGSTGLPYFRPQGAGYEAKDLIIRNNIIEGSSCAVAFVGVNGVEFSGNMVLFPQRWLFRILQENTGEGFVPCRNGIVRANRFVFRRADLRADVNVGGGTAPETFRFEANQWFAEDQPGASRPKLPVEEIDGRYGEEPR